MDVGEFIVPVPYIKQVKAVIRRLLLSTLDDPNRKLCTAISMVVAAIAVYDWPESWPDLLPFLLKLIGDQTSMNGDPLYARGIEFELWHELVFQQLWHFVLIFND
ncbi:hypothetical protein V6Z11_A07G219200 [Gossypium hirsutum]